MIDIWGGEGLYRGMFGENGASCSMSAEGCWFCYSYSAAHHEQQFCESRTDVVQFVASSR